MRDWGFPIKNIDILGRDYQSYGMTIMFNSGYNGTAF